MIALTRRYLVVLWLACVTACLAFLGLDEAVSKSETATFDEISVKRINIVEPDGQYRLVLSNSERFPGLFMGGKEYKHHSRSGGGMLFFNDNGDEVGGLTTHTAEEDGEYSASAGLMFDQYKQDQTVGVVYSDRNGQRVAGLRVWDRPEYSIEPLMEFSDRAARAGTDSEREAIRKEMLDYAMAHGGVGALRFFAGKELQDTVVRLADPEGRPRLELKVDAAGEASVAFLDADGKVVKRITAD